MSEIGFKSLRSLHFYFQAFTQITLLSYNIQLQQIQIYPPSFNSVQFSFRNCFLSPFSKIITRGKSFSI